MDLMQPIDYQRPCFSDIIRCAMEDQNFADVYAALRALLHEYGTSLNFSRDSDTGLVAETKSREGKSEFFAGAEIKKNYVSFHLMPIYCFPDLALAISPALQKRMQGKSCFNFKKPEPELFAELSKHIKTGIERYRSEGKL